MIFEDIFVASLTAVLRINGNGASLIEIKSLHHICCQDNHSIKLFTKLGNFCQFSRKIRVEIIDQIRIEN